MAMDELFRIVSRLFGFDWFSPMSGEENGYIVPIISGDNGYVVP